MTQPAIDDFPLDPYQRPGIYRRRLRVQTGEGWARAELEDDPHRQALSLHHDGRCITAIEAQALRTPWTACAEAPALLARLRGMPLSLRRGVFVAGNRLHDLDRMARASDTGHVSGSCHVFQTRVVGRALRVHGATRDFSDPAVPLLAGP